MSEPARSRSVSALALLVAATLWSCGGGGGGGGGSSTAAPLGTTFFLQGVQVARALLDVNGELVDLVHPRSVFEVDPVTGVPLPGFPQTLEPGTNLQHRVSINLKQVQDPITPQIPLVPRNAVLVLRFSRDVDVASLLLSDSDPANLNQLSAASPVQVLRKDGSQVPVRAWVQGKEVVLSALLTTTVGWEASPLVFDTLGNAVEDPTGTLRVITNAAAASLRSTAGDLMGPRKDLLATTFKPLPFNPGNSHLDAIVLQKQGTVTTFNGFLPDLTPPRIVRPVALTGTISTITSFSKDGQVYAAIQDDGLASAPNTLANGGAGEWARSLLVITTTGGKTFRHVAAGNDEDLLAVPTFLLEAGTGLDPAVQVGDAYELRRSEFFEPIPPPLPLDPAALARITVDPLNHPRDPLDPEDLSNHDLRYFLRMFDENGIERTDRWNPAADRFLSLPPRTSVELRFSEPMDPASFDPWETSYVTRSDVDKADAAFNRQRIGVTRTSDLNRVVRFVPFLENQVDPAASAFIGFGGTAASLKLVLRTVPDPASLSALRQNLSVENLERLVDLGASGVVGVTDLGGRGLGLPPALLDQGDAANFLLSTTSPGRGPFPPALDFEARFDTPPPPPPPHPAPGHRFMGQATSSVFSPPAGTVYDQVTRGIEYHDYPAQDADGDGVVDRRFIYGPRLLDLGLNIPGRLTGAPATVIEHVMDNFNPPKASPTSPTGQEDVLAVIGFGVRTPLNSPFGARMQHIYRAGDASPAYNDFFGTVLDLVGLAWTPVQNFISPSEIDSIEILVGLSGINNANGPSTKQDNGIPKAAGSGLKDNFDCNLLEWTSNCCRGVKVGLKPFLDQEPHQTTVVSRGTSYLISPVNLFRPANAGALFNRYLPYPTFNAGVDPTFGRSDVFSFPYSSRFPMLIEYRLEPQAVPPSTGNVYRFSPAILSSSLPRFRVWSQGQDPLAHCIPNSGAAANVDYRGGEGGPLIRPGSPLAEPNGIPAMPHPGGPDPSGTKTTPPFGNGQPQIGPYVSPSIPTGYILPPVAGCNGANPSQWRQPRPDATNGNLQGGVPPTCNSLPEMNWYTANGMLAYPLPNLQTWPGPPGQPPTQYYGYGPPGSGNPASPGGNEPNFSQNQLGKYGDNTRYWMLWRYRKRVSIIESPTIRCDSPSGKVRYLHPILDPPLASVDASMSVLVEIKAGTLLDFSVPVLDSGFVSVDDPDFVSAVTGLDQDRLMAKFRTSFGTANGQTQPPSLSTIVIPYEKVKP